MNNQGNQMKTKQKTDNTVEEFRELLRKLEMFSPSTDPQLRKEMLAVISGSSATR